MPAASPSRSWPRSSYGDQVSIRQLLNHTGGVPHDAGPSKRRCTRLGLRGTWLPAHAPASPARLLEVETPAGRLVGNAGGIPGFLSMVLSTQDGRRQLGVMINVLAAPDPVYVAFMRVVRELSSIRPGQVAHDRAL